MEFSVIASRVSITLYMRQLYFISIQDQGSGDTLIASMTVNNLVESLRCMQGFGEWICDQSGSSLKVIALSSESALTDEGTVLTPEKRRSKQDVDELHSGKSQLRPRPKKGKTIHTLNQRVVKFFSSIIKFFQMF